MSRLEVLQKLATAQPDDPLAHYGVGLELTQLERWADAIEAFQQALKCDTQYVAAHFQIAKANLKLEQRDAARDALAAGIAAAASQNDHHAEAEMRELLEAIA